MRIGAAAGPGEGDRRSRRTRPGRADSDAGRTGLLDVLTLELGFVRVRWFGIALALYLIQAARTGPEPRPSVASSVASVVVVGVFGIMNLAIRAGARRATEPRAAARVGMAAFGADIWVLLSLVWLSSYDPEAPAWAVLYILPLEGAIRYQMVGALGTVILMVMSEVLREFYLAARFAGHAVVGAELAFRFGIGAIIALIAGIIAQALKQEAARATDRARLAEEAARRLEASRRELALQHSAVLAGVAAMDLDESLQSMAESIGRDLGFDICVIQTLQGDELHVRGAHGLEESLRNRPVGLGRGITGIVAASRESLAVRDVSLFPGYIEVDPRIRAEIAVPLVVEDQVIGVLDVESADPGIVGPGTLDVLERLGDHIALVVQMGQLLEDRRRTAERLRELDEMKSDFVAITSHELRSPLTAIRGFARTLVDNRARLEPQVVDEFLEGIDRRSGQLSRLLDNLLLVSGIEDSGGPVSSQVVDPAAFLDAVIDQVPEE
ncbi:MAG: GAF domain-containing protein, partial [Actinobacteria bacterium]|nr:GAF domain-containing protein [Actinomycetota bacterium]